MAARARERGRRKNERKEDVTAKEVCEAWVRHKKPELPDTEIQKEALSFWEASSDGSLFHVYAAQEELTRLGLIKAGA